MGGGEAALKCASAASVELHDNHIFSSGSLYFLCSSYAVPPLRIHHLENNYWGTTDLEAIWALIDDSCPYLEVEIEPIAEQPVSTERVTWGAVKSLFRE
jgi:hypothetical protein